MQVIDVLRAEVEAVAHAAFKLRQRPMPSVRLNGQRIASAHGVEVPNQPRISLPGLRSCHLLDVIAVPQATGTAKGRKPALGRDSRARQHEQSVCIRDPHTTIIPDAERNRRFIRIVDNMRMPMTKLALLLLLASPALATAQTPASTSPDYKPTLTFDIASIRESGGVQAGGLRVSVKSPLNSSAFEVTNFPGKSLIQYAFGFGVPIVGAPDWLTEAFYNVQAKSDPSVDEKLAKLPPDQARLEKQHMVAVMLTERFHLKYHMEDRESSVYALSPAKGGVKLLPNKLDPDAPPPATTGNDIQTHGGAQGLEFIGKDLTPTAITALLSSQLEQPVVDHSGMKGYYNVTLQIGREWSAGNPQSWPDILTAVQEQLGLKLEHTKAVIPVLIIDHIEKPTAN